MASIETLVEDIEKLLQDVIDGDTPEVSDEKFAEFGVNIALKLKNALTARNKKSRKTKTLYMSEYGRPCTRQLWYEIRPEFFEQKETLKPANLVKFLYGDILEEVVLVLAQLAGHDVTDEQKECEIELPDGWKLRGRLDAIIDGEIVDVKSTTTYGFKKFKEGTLAKDDPFGYIPQLIAYNEAVHGPRNIKKGHKTSFLAIDKQLGHITRMTIYANEDYTEEAEEALANSRVKFVEKLEGRNPPDRTFKDEPEGKSGNRKLCTSCSYCAHKHECWKDANGGKGLRTFVYSKGPVYLTHVEKEPKVSEAKE